MLWEGAGSAAIMGGMGIAGSLVASAQSKAAAKRLIRWQDLLSRTAMQRRTKDLKAAGLNPILAAGGPGAAVPSGSMPDIKNPGEGAIQGLAQLANLNVSSASAKHLEKTAAKAEVEKEISGYNLKYEERMWKTFEKNPKVQRIILAAMLSDRAGLKSEYGAILEALNIGREGMKGRKQDYRALREINMRQKLNQLYTSPNRVAEQIFNEILYGQRKPLIQGRK